VPRAAEFDNDRGMPGIMTPMPGSEMVSIVAETSRLIMPYPTRISPDVERARVRHLTWVEAQGLWPDPATESVYRATDVPLLLASVYPWAEGEDLDLLTDLMGWSFLWDDSMDRPTTRLANTDEMALWLDDYRSILHGHPPASQGRPLFDTWLLLLRRLEDRTSEQGRRRHTTLWDAALRCSLEEARNNAAKRTPAYQEYLSIRREISGVSLCFCWAEAAGAFELPPYIHASDYLQTLDQDAEDVVMMTNDIFSAAMEWTAGNTDNIIPVLAQEKGCSWLEAARSAVEIINTTMAHFEESKAVFLASPLYQDLKSADRASVDRYIDTMTSWMSGSLNWYRTTVRYK
jgi:Terpene synthase family 2, C-terminal metal binding